MINHYTQKNLSAVFVLGDNFYDNGVKSTSTDSTWMNYWTNIYLTNGSSLGSVPWYAVIGNHDYGYGEYGVQAQIDRTFIADNSTKWVMPAQNYSQSFDIVGGVTVIFNDTTTLSPSVNKCCNEKGGVSTSIQNGRIANQVLLLLLF